MRQCPICKAYMSNYVTPMGKLVYWCSCGYTTERERIVADTHTVVDKNCEYITTYHT